MKPTLTLLTALLLTPLAALQADDTAQLAAILTPAAAHGGTVTIPPGDYELDGAKPGGVENFLEQLSKTAVAASIR